MLRRDLSDLRRTNALDLRKIVQQFAARKLVAKLPRKTKRRWGLRLQVINDFSLRLATFQHDHQFVIDQLSHLIPAGGLEVVVGSSPMALQFDSTRESHRRIYQLPPPGSRVLVLSDLGCLDPSAEAWRAWMRWGRMIVERGCHLQALVPCCESQIVSRLRQVYSIQTWQKASFGVQDDDQRAELLHQLLVLASPAVRVEPGLLRELRLLIPGAGDASLEADFWNHPWLSSNHYRAATIDFRKANDVLRPEFERLDRKLRKEALKRIREWRFKLRGSPEIWFEEVLGLEPDSRKLVPRRDVQDAFAFVRCMDSQRRDVGSTIHSAVEAHACRLTQRIPDAALSDPVVGQMLRVAKRELHPDDQDVAVGTDPREIPSGQDRQYTLSVADGEIIIAPNIADDRSISILTSAATIQSSNEYFVVEAVVNRAQDERAFWKDGAKPDFVSDFGTDQYGAWFEFQVSDERRERSVTQRMRWIPAGSFMMGSPPKEEGPQHRMTLNHGYWMADTPCTQAFWKAITGENPSQFEGSERPVENVAWDDTTAFVAKLASALPGLVPRLPTEAEWEHSCRAGSVTPFCFGVELSAQQANIENKIGSTTDVRSYPANAWGIYDVHGNVWEWCGDWYGEYSKKSQTDPTGPKSGSERVMRGGGWIDGAASVRSACRSAVDPGLRSGDLGFRLLSSAGSSSVGSS